MTFLEALILGVIQGITEFFPVSSSGHLVLAQHFFRIQDNILVFDIYVHFGTLIAIIVVFRDSIVRIISGCVNIVGLPVGAHGSLRAVYDSSREVKTALGIAVGTIPAVFVGLMFKDVVEQLFQSEKAVFLALSFTGVVLLCTFLAGKGGRHIGIRTAFLVGIAQAVAVIPGISRSGMTISTAIFLGIAREEGGEFSFLLSIPAILGATVLAVREHLMSGGLFLQWEVASAGVVVSFLTGWLSLVILMRVVRKGKLGYFGIYCLAVAIIGWAISMG